MKKFIFVIILSLSVFIHSKAQEIIEVSPLFEYPVAPEDLVSLEEKCDYIIKNFWNSFDFKRKEPVDQYALTAAFQVYTSAMRYASFKEAEQSVNKLIEKISGNQVLLIQFCKAAEENLYGPRADFWSDELYLKFLDAIIKNKKITENRKIKYEKQAKALKESLVGATAPSFDFNTINGDVKNYFPMSTPTLLIFGNPEDTDWRLARLKMDSNLQLSDALDKGKVNILYMIPFENDNWKNLVSNYNKQWTVGQSLDIEKHYDLRLDPAIYVVGSDGKILYKNLPVNDIVPTILEIIN